MEGSFVNLNEDFHEKELMMLSSEEGTRVADDNGIVFSASKLKMVLDKIIQERSITPDIKNQRHLQECLQTPCGKEHRIPKYVSLDENLLQRCLDLVEAGASDSLSIICRATTAFGVPANLRSSKMEVLCDSLKPCRRKTTSTGDQGNYFVGCTRAACPRNEITSPIGPLIFDTAEGKYKVRNLLKSPLFFHLPDLDSNMNLGRMKSVRIKDTKYPESISFASDLSIPSPQKPLIKNLSVVKQRYGSKITDKIPVPCSSTNSTSSRQSTSSACVATSKGVIHCVWKSGTPYFVFSLDDQGEVYIANPYNIECSDDKTLDYIYEFHSQIDDKKEQGGRGNNVSGLVGKMKVSSSLILTSTDLKLRETEFVLFGAGGELLGDMQSSTPRRKNKRLSKKVADIFRTNSCKHKFTTQFGNPSSIFDEFSQEPQVDMLCMLNELDKDNLLLIDPTPNLELAAIVVKDHHHDDSQETGVGGWGLNFLKKVGVQCGNGSLQSSSESCEGSCLRNENEGLMSMDVLVPAAFHGGPRSKIGGPSSLTQRWRSGGHCDCGGWDIGCPLTVLNTKSRKAESPSEIDAQEDCRSFDLFIEGAKQGVPALTMVNVHEGLYYIHFQSTLSALQSFSIGVAIIHAQTPSLRSKSWRG
ncbi:uncharacterized protein LOC131240543 isoform X1 [Magnolia sinica]|uniref:uncharacterized protein LOC131240543 isoform X1 n=1 Tax=Magnolia sinica TaxID=86752 RepID=UPI002659F5E6|nr:uncharacterized protein LOC131240543 isoform X1 [Magnolia sinica]XP_058094814.1 uncharacterized protein LOC131240543 isoform X1 [Magnolia sinica]